MARPEAHTTDRGDLIAESANQFHAGAKRLTGGQRTPPIIHARSSTKGFSGTAIRRCTDAQMHRRR